MLYGIPYKSFSSLFQVCAFIYLYQADNFYHFILPACKYGITFISY